MRKKAFILCFILVFNTFLGVEIGVGGDIPFEKTFEYQILKRGVQDFSDGNITIVENSVEIVPDDEYYVVLGAQFECIIRKELSQNFLVLRVGDASITYEISEEQSFGKVKKVKGITDEKKKNCIEYRSISEDLNLDLQYTFTHHKVLEEFVLRKFQNIHITERFKTENLWVSEKEGGVYFYHSKTGKLIFYIPPPVMYEEENPFLRNNSIHYEVKLSGDTYLIKKVIDKEGLDWLKSDERVYPVIIDSTTQGGFSDPWEESGLIPYGQYFRNLNEYVSPANGGLTVKQVDLYLPGRGMDLAVTRIYTTPQLFAQDPESPEYFPTEEDSPWKIANGWRFDFPVITENYLYLWEGRMYKLEWDNVPPECPACPVFEPPDELIFTNHEGDHFILIKHKDSTYTLYLKDGRVVKFSDLGIVEQIKDANGNEIKFSVNALVSEGKVTITMASITDTIGRVVIVSGSGVLYGQRSVDYTIQYTRNSKGVYEPLLTSATDCLGRKTIYSYDYTEFSGSQNRWLMTRISYPTKGYTTYTYGRKEVRICKDSSCHVWNEDCHEVTDCYDKFYQFLVVTQKVYKDVLTKVCTFSYTGDWESIFSSVERTKDENEYVQTTAYFSIDNGKVMKKILKDYNSVQVESVEYTYDSQGNIVLATYCKGSTNEPTFRECSSYDEWGNQTYYRNSLGYETFSSYINTSGEGVFRDYSANTVNLFSNSFYTNSLEGFDRLAGTCTVQNGSTVESYYLYDNKGNVVELRNISQKKYIVFRGVFDEGGQKTFSLILDRLPSSFAYLRIWSLPTQNAVQKSETHNVSQHNGYRNTGYWKNPYFYAYWTWGSGGDVGSGYDPVGPFVHYPGTPGYQNYTMWLEGRVQYVKTNYQVYENISPFSCSYRLNNGTWTQITSNLGNSTAQIQIPREKFLLQNTIEFSESSSYKTRFQWTLYVPVNSSTQTFVQNFTYDSYGNLISAATCSGEIFLEYSEDYNSGYLTAITDPLGNRMSAQYDEMGNIILITDARGHTYTYEYDILGRLRKKINPDSTEREAVYDDQNNLVIIYDELDHPSRKYFDELGRIEKIETEVYTEEYTYNYLGKVETRTDPLMRVYTYEYDVLGRILKVYKPDGTQNQWVYNNLQNTVEVYDENFHKTEYKYDWAGNLVSVKEYSNTVYLTEYSYDEFGNVIKIKDTKGRTTSYEYGVFGLERVIYPDFTEENFVYDCIGNVIEKTIGNRTVHYQYNTASQLIQILYPDSSVTFSYDENGNRMSMEDAASSASYVYDSRNRLVFETKTIDSIEYTLSYLYDASSNLVSITYPDGTSIQRDYDNLRRLESVEGYAQFSWNENSQLTQILYENGVTTDYSYDLVGRVTNIHALKNGDLLNLSYVYDPAGNILQMKNLENGTIKEQWEYTYDPLNRLKTAAGGTISNTYSLNFSYDEVGNRIQLNTTAYTYNAMNELLTESGSRNITYAYDIYGNLISKNDGGNSWEYNYNSQNRLTSVEKNGEIEEQYIYDGDGKRIKKIDSESERVYIYSGLNVLYEINITTQMDAVYIYGPAGMLAKKVNDITEFYHTDQLGSTKLITSENGVKTEEIQYKPFGEKINTSEERYTYNGKELDGTGLYYYGTRYYDPETGRFISKDPLQGDLESPQSLNRYVYCLNNPLRYIDPTGTKEKSAQEKVEDVFARLGNVDPEQLAEIQEQLDNGIITALEALMMILEMLGFAVTDNKDGTLSMKIGEDTYTVGIDNNLKDPKSGISAWGSADIGNKTITLNFKSGKIGDVMLTVLHEVSHVVLGGANPKKEHQYIYSVEYSYMIALQALGVEFSTGGIKDDKLLPDFVTHVKTEAGESDRWGIHRVPMLEVAKILTRGWRRW